MEMKVYRKKRSHPRVTCSYKKGCNRWKEGRKEGRHTRCGSVSASVRRCNERTIHHAEVQFRTVEPIRLGLYLNCRSLTRQVMWSLQGNSSMTMIQSCSRMSRHCKACMLIDPQPSRFLWNKDSSPLHRKDSWPSPQDKVCMLIDLQSSSFRHYNPSKTMIPLCLCMSQARKPCIHDYPLASKFPWDMMDCVSKIQNHRSTLLRMVSFRRQNNISLRKSDYG